MNSDVLDSFVPFLYIDQFPKLKLIGYTDVNGNRDLSKTIQTGDE